MYHHYLTSEKPDNLNNNLNTERQNFLPFFSQPWFDEDCVVLKVLDSKNISASAFSSYDCKNMTGIVPICEVPTFDLDQGFPASKGTI